MGVVYIKKKYLLVLITVLFISLSVVSAANDTNVENEDSDVISDDTSTANTELVTKKTLDNVTKTSTTSSKTASKTSVNAVTAKYNVTAKLSANITNAVTGKKLTEGKVVFKLNGNTIGYSNVDNGVATYYYDTSRLTPKNYTITVKYGGNSQYLASSSTSTLTVVKDASKIVLDNVTVISKEKVKFTATVTDKNGNFATSGRVAFKINGKTVGYANVSKGKAVFTYTANLSAKTYKLNATYGGNTYLNKSYSPKSTLTVTQRPTKMTVSSVSGYSTSLTLTASVVDKLTSKALTSGTIVFKINDKTIGNATISNGKASYKYDFDRYTRGTYKISAHYKPTSFYATSTATNNLTIKAESSFTYDQIKAAAVYVRTQYESNFTVSSVNISKSRLPLSDFLALMIQACENAYKGKKANVAYKKYSEITSQTDSMKQVVLNISEVREIGNRTLKYMNEHGMPPKYVTTDYGLMGYFNIVYTYCRVMDVSAYNYLPTTCRVYGWAAMHPSNPKSRTIYLTSDVIVNKATDYAFMNKIKASLEKKGYKAVVNGYGPNSHNTAILAQSLPINAVQVSIFGGADAGVFYDMSTRYYMRNKESRLIYLIFHPDYAYDFTGVSFLKRAHDDNYSPSSFTGLSNPDEYLYNYGYDYLFSKDPDEIAAGIIYRIS